MHNTVDARGGSPSGSNYGKRRNRRPSALDSVLGAISLIMLSVSSFGVSATLVDVHVSGTFFEGTDNNNTLGLSDHTPVTLTGRSITVDFSYDTNLVPAQGSPGPGIFYYQTPIADPWLSPPRVTIDNVGVPTPTKFPNPNGVPQKSIHIQGGDPGFLTLSYQDSTAGENGEPLGKGLGTFQVFLSFPIPSPTPFLPTEPVVLNFRPLESGQLLIGDTTNTVGGNGTYFIAANFAPESATIIPRAVPVPAAGWLFISATFLFMVAPLRHALARC